MLPIINTVKNKNLTCQGHSEVVHSWFNIDIFQIVT